MKLVFILENIRSVLNVGSIFRTADCLGAEVFLCGYSPTPHHPKFTKTALGAEKTVRWKHFDTVKQAVDTFRSNFPHRSAVYAVEITEEAKILWEESFPLHVALIFGNEVKGVSKTAMRLAHKTIKIPMFGSKESFNVAVAVGICGYEVVRQWNK